MSTDITDNIRKPDGKRKLIIAGLLIYIALLIASIPSSIIPWIMQKYGIKDMGMQNTTGTIWNGSGLLISPSGNNSAYAIANISWNLSISRLFIGRIMADINFNDDALMGKTVITLSHNEIVLDNLKIGMPASTVSYFFKPAALIGPSGNVTVNSNHLEVRPGSIIGKLKIQWHDASSKMSEVRPLGSYELDIVGNKDGKRARINLKTLSGKLDATASGYWDIAKSGRINISGFATPKSDQEQLEPLLQLLGRDMGGGKRRIALNRALKYKSKK